MSLPGPGRVGEDLASGPLFKTAPLFGAGVYEKTTGECVELRSFPGGFVG